MKTFFPPVLFEREQLLIKKISSVSFRLIFFMLMDEGEKSSKARPRRLLFWVTFLFCFCFIISVYAPLNSLRLLPSPPQFTQQNIEKLSSTALEPQRIGKIKQKKNCLLFTEAGKNRNLIQMV